MKPKVKKSLYWLIGLLIVIVFAVVMANQVRSDFGKTEVTYVKIQAPDGHVVTGRLYRPMYATDQNKLPAVITIHGGNNDKDTQAPAAIELSRRGFVVLSIDMDGHGDNSSGLIFAEYATGGTLGGPIAFDYLKTLPYVDAARIGLTGHSMGGSESVKTAALRPEHKAVVPQDSCSKIDRSVMHNYLCILAGWEYNSFQPSSALRRDSHNLDPKFYEGFYGFTEPIAYDRVYGSFADDTAFKIALNPTTHPGMPPSNQMVTTLVDWMREALKDGKFDEHWIPSIQHIYVWYDVFMGLALLAALGSVIPLTNILLTIPLFANVASPMPRKYVAKSKAWWKMALLNAFIAGVTYPLLTPFGWFPGRGIAPTLLAKYLPFLKTTVPAGLLMWMIGNVIIFAILFFFWYRKNSKENKITMYDLGVSFDEKQTKFNWGVLGRTLLLAILLVGWLYLLVSISQAIFGIEFRVEYATLKTFPNFDRFGQFLIYLIPVLIFMLLNNGLFLFGQARQPEYENERKTQIIWWLKNVFASLTFLGVVLALQNIPIMVLNTTYGYNLSGFTKLIATWSGGAEWMYAIVLWFLIPLMTVLTYFLTWFFRRTGKIYLGAAFVALVIVWIWAVGNLFIS